MPANALDRGQIHVCFNESGYRGVSQGVRGDSLWIKSSPYNGPAERLPECMSVACLTARPSDEDIAAISAPTLHLDR